MYVFTRAQPFGLVLLAANVAWRTFFEPSNRQLQEEVEDVTDEEQELYKHRRYIATPPTSTLPSYDRDIRTTQDFPDGNNNSNSSADHIYKENAHDTFEVTEIYDWKKWIDVTLALFSAYSTIVWLLKFRQQKHTKHMLIRQDLLIAELQVALEDSLNQEQRTLMLISECKTNHASEIACITASLKERDQDLRHQKEIVEFLVKSHDELKKAREESLYASKCLRIQNEQMRKEILENTERYKRVIQDLPLLILPPPLDHSGHMTQRFSECQ